MGLVPLSAGGVDDDEPLHAERRDPINTTISNKDIQFFFTTWLPLSNIKFLFCLQVLNTCILDLLD